MDADVINYLDFIEVEDQRSGVLSPHLSIKQCHWNVAIDVAPPRAQRGELHRGWRWEGRCQ